MHWQVALEQMYSSYWLLKATGTKKEWGLGILNACIQLQHILKNINQIGIAKNFLGTLKIILQLL